MVLGLHSAEVSILNTLSLETNMSVSNIAAQTKIPRTTVNFLLWKLKHRQLVNRLKIGGHYEWQFNPLENFLVTTESELYSGVPTTRTYRGKNGVKKALLKILKEAQSERLYFIQGNPQAEIAVSSIDPDFLLKFHAQFKKQKTISEGVAGERVIDYIKELTRKELISHKDRLLITHLLPDKFMDQIKVEIYVIKYNVYIADYSQELITQICFEPFAKTFKAIIEYIKEGTRSTNLNAYIDTRLKVF